PIKSLRPTQITVGMREVEEKRKRLRKHKSRKIGKFIDNAPLWRHVFIGKLFDRLCVLGQMCQPHAAQYVWRLTELDVLVCNDLYAIAPRVHKIEKRAGQWFNIRIDQRLADRFLVIDHKSKMAAVVSRLLTALLKCKELVA